MKMKTINAALVLLFITAINFAQTGIGTTSPHPSAQLEVSSPTKWFSRPRMTGTVTRPYSSAFGIFVVRFVVEVHSLKVLEIKY